MLASDIRSSFLKFYESNGHTIVESSSVVPQNDPSLLFTNAGMVQFKNVFTGLEKRNYTRATTSQKCIRAGGKHNDLDQVGFTARHHTFFEMLGNFSFGDYFKEEAINFAWKFLTQELKLPKEKLLVTVYHTDDEAKKIWEKVAGNITIIPIKTSDNFWSMGDTGPCGPCTEIFYDHGEEVAGGMPGTPDEDGDRYMEIWNIVFMQFNQVAGGEKISLEKKCIDTGMGLERIASIMQGVNDNYLTDLFKEIIGEIKEVSKTNFPDLYPSYKVIADHIRSISFLIADGVTPSNEGRRYVLRRILRRAMRHGNLIGIKKPFLCDLSSSVVNSMGDIYPELKRSEKLLHQSILSEEEKFLTTLGKGLKILQQDKKNLRSGEVLSGDIAFKLYDTYGFPLDLTQDVLKADGISVDIDGFEKALKEQQQRAKWAGSGDTKEDSIWYELSDKLSATKFLGYEKSETAGKIIALIQNNKSVEEISESGNSRENDCDNEVYIVADQTVFYAECGGQCGDTGIISIGENKFRVLDTKKFCDKMIAHRGRVISGKFKISDEVNMQIDSTKRRRICANHTATHLLQAALRKVLGDHVMQRGSFLNDERLRFDFTHNGEISDSDLKKIEDLINAEILKNSPIIVKEMTKTEAIAAGATALFGEKYHDVVRTVKIADSDKAFSFELCGGTHAKSTGEIGLCKILSESSIGSGIRRIEAITGYAVLDYVRDQDKKLSELGEKLKCTATELSPKVGEMLKELKSKDQEILRIRQTAALEKIVCEQVGDVDFASIVVENFSAEELRSLNNLVKNKSLANIVALISLNDGDGVSILVNVDPNFCEKYSADKILKTGLALLDGHGGGNAKFAQGGGRGSADCVDSLLKKMRSAIC